MSKPFDNPVTVHRPVFPEGKRILVISDIHGNLPYFRALLEKCGFSEDDILILDGDFLDKGACSLDTLRFIMELSARGNVYPVCGNCDDWHDIFAPEFDGDAQVLRYVQWRRCGLLWDMLTAMGLDLGKTDSLTPHKDALFRAFPEEWAFLASLPQIIETEKFIFVHGGIYPDRALEAHCAGEVRKFDNFMGRGFRFDKWVIAGHWPVMLYRKNIVCANPLIDPESRIVSIDGGCVLKDDGQLNALVIPHKYSEDFSWISYDPFPVRRVKQAQRGSDRSYYIRWGDNEVQVLQRGPEFSRCRHLRTGYEMEILTKYLFSGEEVTKCNDCTDYVLPLAAGDEVSVVEECSRGCFVKHNGVSGWYFGELE